MAAGWSTPLTRIGFAWCIFRYFRKNSFFPENMESNIFKLNDTGDSEEDIEISFRFCHQEERHISGEVRIMLLKKMLDLL